MGFLVSAPVVDQRSTRVKTEHEPSRLRHNVATPFAGRQTGFIRRKGGKDPMACFQSHGIPTSTSGDHDHRQSDDGITD